MKLIQPIDNAAKVLLLARLKDEMTAYYFYTNWANFFDNIGRTLLAQYCRNEAADELTHAQKLQNYLIGWGVFVMLPSPGEITEPKTMVQFFEDKYTIEGNLYTAYNDNAQSQFSHDKSLFALFMDMVDIQKVSIFEAKTHLDQLALINTDDKLSLFQFEQELFEA